MNRTAATSIPRSLWVLWYQGVNEAPFVVRKCIDSWVQQNPTWDIIVLDKDTLKDYIVPDLPEPVLSTMAINKQSNLFRLQLLSDYGGVWADATTYCMKPLDDWIDAAASSGFFVFHQPNKDRLLSNWFIASEQGCPVVTQWREQYASFFSQVNYDVDRWYKHRMIKILKKWFNRSSRSTRCWLSPFVTRVLRIYPYFICHYIFERVVSCDHRCREIWSNTEKISAHTPHRLKKFGLLARPDQALKHEIMTRQAPLYKLTWKYDHAKYTPATVLHYVLEGRFEGHRPSANDTFGPSENGMDAYAQKAARALNDVDG